MHTTIRKGILILVWSITRFMGYLAIEFISFITEPSSKFFSLIVFAIFGLFLYATLNLQTTILIINEEGIIRKMFFTKKRIYWTEINRILIDPDYNVRLILNSKIVRLSLSQFRWQGEFLGKINKYAEDKISKTINFYDVVEIRNTKWLLLLVIFVIGILVVLQDYVILVGLILGVIRALQRVSKLINRPYMKDKLTDNLVPFILMYLTTSLVVRMNTDQLEKILTVMLLPLAWITGSRIIYAIFKGKIQNAIEQTLIDDGKMRINR